MMEKDERIANASEAYADFMDVIMPGWQEDPGSQGTPERISRMFINEILNHRYGEEPRITTFPNEAGYGGIVTQLDIPFTSFCSHHHLPFIGKVHFGYIPGKKIIGLSKINRIITFLSQDATVQETLTEDIYEYFQKLLPENKGVAILIEAEHTCVRARGVKHSSIMKTAKFSGYFFENEIGTRDEFLGYVRDLKK